MHCITLCCSVLFRFVKEWQETYDDVFFAGTVEDDGV